jgi:hypothetical protein
MLKRAWQDETPVGASAVSSMTPASARTASSTTGKIKRHKTLQELMSNLQLDRKRRCPSNDTKRYTKCARYPKLLDKNKLNKYVKHMKKQLSKKDEIKEESNKEETKKDEIDKSNQKGEVKPNKVKNIIDNPLKCEPFNQTNPNATMQEVLEYRSQTLLEAMDLISNYLDTSKDAICSKIWSHWNEHVCHFNANLYSKENAQAFHFHKQQLYLVQERLGHIQAKLQHLNESVLEDIKFVCEIEDAM